MRRRKAILLLLWGRWIHFQNSSNGDMYPKYPSELKTTILCNYTAFAYNMCVLYNIVYKMGSLLVSCKTVFKEAFHYFIEWFKTKKFTERNCFGWLNESKPTFCVSKEKPRKLIALWACEAMYFVFCGLQMNYFSVFPFLPGNHIIFNISSMCGCVCVCVVARRQPWPHCV